MAGFDFSDVLAAANGIPGLRDDGKWRCVVYLSAFDWMYGWLRPADMAAQSAACKRVLAAHGDLRKAETVRNRNAVRNVRAAFDELMGVIENRRADCVVVPDIAVLATCFSEARFYVAEVLAPMGFRFIDCAHGFDTLRGDAGAYLKGLQTEMSDARALRAERDRLASGGLIRRNVPYGYVLDEGEPCGVRVDGEVAAFVPKIFEVVAQERWWRGKLEAQVRELGCPGPRQRTNALYGLSQHCIDGWDYAAIRSMVRNPFYMGDYVPEALASIRMRKSGIALESFAAVEHHHPALVSRELFEAANEGLARNKYACPTEAEGRRPCRG